VLERPFTIVRSRNRMKNKFIMDRRGGQRHPADFQGLLPFFRTEVFRPDAWGKKETFFPRRTCLSYPFQTLPRLLLCPNEKYQVIAYGQSV
jgi:hypothetical protein